MGLSNFPSPVPVPTLTPPGAGAPSTPAEILGPRDGPDINTGSWVPRDGRSAGTCPGEKTGL
ncbi:hypothetical protein MMCCUG48898_1152 [Mycobacteroides abscessus subsp. massiliense CCUG 48898 = JCM 15300]|nr:hypothetical protein MA4S0726RA_1167 [Mycobacteroides abscessus 4S-0726-RA]EIT99645.1 hypothetical protein MA4S0303_1634 [Mycobacteroides abscessus 4S-0303]EIV67820.1 hypothetical protein MMCCUG48898_1152 [Mycobacteroides abscessus subsp. massiliense CCUG 48898 = JCM 15300]ESV59122.1 hypothetical protein L830_4974 [Mycobacteroides abscessus MAB_082312_2258]ETZ71058.1 hypothetical protein L835_3984 [Mycobacteroides abscessus MAB_110811_1470]ETZ80937.1 hypothetical protein L834_1144 [Mycobact